MEDEFGEPWEDRPYDDWKIEADEVQVREIFLCTTN